MRVLHYSTYGERCGIAGYCADLVRELDARGIESEVEPVNRADSAYLAPREWAAKLARLVERAQGFDLVHFQHEFSFFGPVDRIPDGNRQFFRTLESLHRLRVPVVATFHTMPFFVPELPTPAERLKKFVKGSLFGWKPKRTLGDPRRKVRVVVHTKRSRLQLIRLGVSDELVRVIPMGVGERAEVVREMPSAEAKARLGLPAGCTLLSLFGFIAQYKGHLDVVKALERLPEHFVFAAVGGPHPEGRDRTLDRMLKDWQGDPRRLVITGHVPTETLDLYHAATDICLAPYTDPKLASSAAITWAVSSGKPVVASTIPTFRELAGKHNCLKLCNPKAPHELAWTIERLAASEVEKRELVANANAYCEQAGWPNAAAEVLGIYEELLGRRDGGAPRVTAARVGAGRLRGVGV